ncbi:MAG: OB-fold nucleic acid binding domain-containing protein [Candidatus Micrarchaeota archaeon]
MQEKKLAALCAAGALLGILILAAYSSSLAPQEKDIAQISAADEGRLVTVAGSVSGVYSRSGNWFFTLCRTSCIKAYVPPGAAKSIGAQTDLKALRKGSWILFSGKISTYKGALEIVAQGSGAIEVLRQ